jgi:hypothetical protein
VAIRITSSSQVKTWKIFHNPVQDKHEIGDMATLGGSETRSGGVHEDSGGLANLRSRGGGRIAEPLRNRSEGAAAHVSLRVTEAERFFLPDRLRAADAEPQARPSSALRGDCRRGRAQASRESEKQEATISSRTDFKRWRSSRPRVARIGFIGGFARTGVFPTHQK